MFKAVITTVVMALSEKQKNCSSDKTTTVCGDSSESLQLPTKPHSRGCESTYNKVLFTPPTMCRLTVSAALLACTSSSSTVNDAFSILILLPFLILMTAKAINNSVKISIANSNSGNFIGTIFPVNNLALSPNTSITMQYHFWIIIKSHLKKWLFSSKKY